MRNACSRRVVAAARSPEAKANNATTDIPRKRKAATNLNIGLLRFILLFFCFPVCGSLFLHLAINQKDKRQNRLREGENGEPNDIQKIVDTYQFRREEPRYSKRVSLERIEQEDFNLNITRYVSTAQEEEPIDLQKVNDELKEIARRSKETLDRHNEFLKELGLPPIAD